MIGLDKVWRGGLALAGTEIFARDFPVRNAAPGLGPGLHSSCE